MSPRHTSLSIKIGAATMASMLLTMVGLSILLAVSDADASGPSPQSPTPSASDGITSFAVDTAPTLRVIGDPQSARRAYVMISKAGTEVFVYTRNADGVVTDPD